MLVRPRCERMLVGLLAPLNLDGSQSISRPRGPRTKHDQIRLPLVQEAASD